MERTAIFVAALVAWVPLACASEPGGTDIGSSDAGRPPTQPPPPPTRAGRGLQVYGAWHCSDDACTWSKTRTPRRLRREQPLAHRPGRWNAVGEPRHLE